jgi:hypothetical protein
MRTCAFLYLILGLISTVYALPFRGSYVVTYSTDYLSPAKSGGHFDHTEIDNGVVELINKARKEEKYFGGPIHKDQVTFTNSPSGPGPHFYCTFTGPMCAKGECIARGMDSRNPTEDVVVFGSLYSTGKEPVGR